MKKKQRVRSAEAIASDKGLTVYQPHDEPAFFDLTIEKRHAHHLSKKTLDKESRLQVIYRILKDQLRIAKKQLLVIKKNNAAEAAKALELKRKMQIAAAKKDENSIAGQIKEVVNDEGKSAFKFIGSQRHLTPKLKAIISHLLNTDKSKHNKYCPCCRNYQEGDDPTADQMGEFLEFIRQQHIKIHGKKKNLMKRIKLRDE